MVQAVCLIGAGVGMAFGTIISLLAFVVSESNRNKNSRFDVFLCTKLLISLILIIVGSVSLDTDRMGAGLLGTGIGLLFGSVVSGILFYSQCCNN